MEKFGSNVFHQLTQGLEYKTFRPALYHAPDESDSGKLWLTPYFLHESDAPLIYITPAIGNNSSDKQPDQIIPVIAGDL